MAYLLTKFKVPSDTRLQVAGEEIYFPLEFGNNWQAMRIGVLLSFNALTPTVFSTLFGVSVCRGNKGFFHPTPDDVWAFFIGGGAASVGITNTTPNVTVVDASAVPAAFSMSNGGCLAQKRTGFMGWTGSNAGLGYFVSEWYNPGAQSISGFYVDLDRLTTAGSMRAQLWAPVSLANARINVPLSTFVSGLYGAPANMGNPTGVITVAYTGTANTFDTLTFFNNGTGHMAANIEAIGVARTA